MFPALLASTGATLAIPFGRARPVRYLFYMYMYTGSILCGQEVGAQRAQSPELDWLIRRFQDMHEVVEDTSIFQII